MINLDEILKQGVEMQFSGKKFTMLQPTIKIVKELSKHENEMIAINKQELEYQQGKTKTRVNTDRLFDIRCDITLLLLNNNADNVKFTLEDVKKLGLKIQVDIYNQINKFVYDLTQRKN